ncbi:MAG: MATE family efflux transporter, partial [Streptococcaceae bacterium]|nr:MATE family efflux transporter [Streptococcaceae bacterium]
ATFAAQNYGAKQYLRINQGLVRALLLSISWALGFAIFLNVFHYYFTTAFISASQTTVLHMSQQYYLVNGSMYWLLAILFVTRSTIQGLGNAKIPTICGFMEMISRIAVAIIGVALMNYMVVVTASPMAWIGSTVILIPTTIRLVKKNRSLSALTGEF